MTGISVADDDFKQVAEPTLKRDGPASPLAAEPTEPNVYAAYWQARSGFFNPPPNLTTASTGRMRNGLP